jgi:hypothetical protein
MDTSELLDGETLAVVNWRHDMLILLGLTEDDAQWISNGNVDWHAIERLIHAGCPVALAVDIAT